MNRFSVLLSTVASLTFATSFAVAADVSVSPDQGKTEFHAVGRPSMIKINGEGKGPQGKLSVNGSKVTGILTFDMKSLTSGISMRDTHMKDKYLEVGKYPTATLKLTDASLPSGWSPSKPTVKGQPFKGDLTLHGVTKPVEGKFDVTGAGGGFNVAANFEVKIDQYGIDIPRYLGITVRNEVPVDIQMRDLKAH